MKRSSRPVSPDRDIEAAFRQLRAGRAERAAAIARRVLDRYPRHHGALNLAALAALHGGDVNQAIIHWERATTLAPDQPIYHCNLGLAYHRARRHDAAIDRCRRALALRPGYVNAWINLGAAQFAAEQYPAAQASYEAALSHEPRSALLHAYRADALREQGRIRAAVQDYERALALDPDLAHALGNYGMLLPGVGQAERALDYCRRATDKDPANALHWLNLGRVLRLLGRLPEAMEAFAAAYERDPGSAPLCTAIGQVWQEVSDLPQALEWYDKALALEPQRLETRCALAGAMLDAGNPAEALARYRAILADHPEHFEAHCGLAQALWDEGDADAAVAQCRHAVGLRPEEALAHARLGTILASAGEVEAANDSNRRALDLNPRCVPALVNLAQNLRGRLPADDVARMQDWLEAGWAREGTQASLHFGLAHYYDGVRDYARAAEHAVQANALHTAFKRERGWAYDPADYARHVDQLIARFTPDFFARSRGMGHPSDAPVFIVGMPRSGTTLTEQILASHPLAFGAGERKFAGRAFNRLPQLLGRDGVAPADCLDALTAPLVRQLAGWHLEQLRALAGKAGGASSLRIIDKMPDNYSLLGWIVTAFPNAKIIHCRRDVRDVALSCWMTPFAEIRWAFDLEHIAQRIRQYRRLMAHWRQVLPVPMLEIDYEDTVADQRAQTARLLEFVGLPWDDACIAFHRTERLVRTASVTQVRQPIYNRSVERWRRYEAMLRPLLERLEE